MSVRHLVFFFAAFLFLSCAASKTATMKDQGTLADVQEFDVDGVHVLLRQSTAAQVISAVLFIKGGITALQPDELTSTEYFAMNIAPASGSQRLSKSYFRRRMVSMGTAISGGDGRDFSALTLRCVKENFDTSWRYFTDIVTQPAFDPVEFHNFKNNVLLGINSRQNDADVYSYIVLDSIYFKGRPYGRMLSVQDVEGQTIERIKAHYKTIMIKSRLLLSVVGNVSREELSKKISEGLGDLPEGDYRDPVIDPPTKAFSPGVYFPKFDRKLPTDYMLAYYLIPSKGDSDYYPYIRLRNFFGGFVFNHIRVQNSLAYAPNVDEHENKTSVGVISVQTGYVDSVAKIIYNDVDFFQDNLIRSSAIQSGVAKWATSNFMKEETSQSQAVSLGQAKLMTGDWRNAFISFQKLADVTPEQLNTVAKKYLRNFNWVIIGDTAHVDKALLMSR